jgi:metal iron transporter
MNCPTRDPEPAGRVGFNQSPSALDSSLFPRSHLTDKRYNGGTRPSDSDRPTDPGGDGLDGAGESSTDPTTNLGQTAGKGGSNEPPNVATTNALTATSSHTMPKYQNYNTGDISRPDSTHSQISLHTLDIAHLNVSTSSVRAPAATLGNQTTLTSQESSAAGGNRNVIGLLFPARDIPNPRDRRISSDRGDAGRPDREQYRSNRELEEGQHEQDIPLKNNLYRGTEQDGSNMRSLVARRHSSQSDLNHGTKISYDSTEDSNRDQPAKTTGSSGHPDASLDYDNIYNDQANIVPPGVRPSLTTTFLSGPPLNNLSLKEKFDHFLDHSRRVAFKYAKFVGPGIMVSVAYLDPGNYATAVSAGAMYQYKHLFVILLSNLFAVFLQILCTKLGSVTGLDLAQNCREHLPHWLCMLIYCLTEVAIIATDLAEVVGTAIALNILLGIPLPVGVVLTVTDVLLVLLAYRPNGPVKFIRYFEYMVSALVFVVVVCFAVELSSIGHIGAGAVFRGFLPSPELVESQGLYMSCGILGATVMPHSLYLGSGLVQPRLREYDTKHGYYNSSQDSDDGVDTRYRPTIHAIRYAMNFSIAELVISLFTVAIFVNSAILIVAGATLSNSPDDALDADLFSIYDMLTKYLGAAAGTIFALALLFSGQSAGIVCTLAGQMVSEGFLHWSFQPWIRRLITRSMAVAPCLLVSIFVGRKGLADVLNASQVVLSLLLPVVSAPLLYFTCSNRIMRVPVTSKRTRTYSVGTDGYAYTPVDNGQSDENLEITEEPEYVDMSNSLITNVLAICIFCFVSALNCFLLVSMALGADVHV